MEKTSKLLKPLLLAIAAAAAGSAAAAPANHVGTPDPKPAVVDTVGIDVEAGAALKSIIPENWGVLVHKNSTLPSKLSWSEGKDWVSTLVKVLEPHKMNVKVDWTKKTVFVKKQAEVAVAAAEIVQPELDEVKTLKLTFQKGERLSSSLDKLFKQVGFTGKYLLEGNDLESEEEASVTGTSLSEVLNKALPAIGLTAEIYKPSKIVVIKYRNEVAK